MIEILTHYYLTNNSILHEKAHSSERNSMISFQFKSSLLVLIQLVAFTNAFAPTSPFVLHHHQQHQHHPKTQLNSYTTSKSRETILQRNGAHFKLNRFGGKVEFGSTANLVTKLDGSDKESIIEWLSDEKRVALSIWDEKLLKDLGNSIYRLQLMTLQFVTIQLAPSVDNRMWIEKDAKDGVPVFKLQSIDFDPNIQLLPGLNIPAESLGIRIEVVGELRPSKDGKGVEGRIGFVSGGDLPPPMRLLPEPALKSASDLICKTVTDFAIMSFQNGARAKYQEFLKTRQ